MIAPAPFQPSPSVSPQATPSELVVRRDVRRHLRSALALAGIAALLVCWVPAIIVLVRREPAYFTNGIVLSALIGTAIVLLVGVLLAVWVARGSRVVLKATAGGLELPGGSGRPALSCRWEDVTLIRLIGRRDPALAFYVRDLQPLEAETVDDGPDLSEPAFLRPLDFQADPPPATRLPEPAAFDKIRPFTEPAAQPARPEPVIGGTELLHATPYVVSVSHTDPPLPQVLRGLTRLAGGRVRMQ